MELAKDGTQPFMQGRVMPEELSRNLTPNKPYHWVAVQVVMKWGTLCAGVQQVQGRYRTQHPSQAAQRHKCTATAALTASRVRSSP